METMGFFFMTIWLSLSDLQGDVSLPSLSIYDFVNQNIIMTYYDVL